MDFDKIKSLLVILIPYAALCGYLYFISFFQTFNIYGLSFVDYTEVIQTIAYTFCITFGFSTLLNVVLNFIIFDISGLKKGGGNHLVRRYTVTPFQLSIIFIAWIIIIWQLYPSPEKSSSYGAWYLWGSFAFFAPYLLLDRSDFLSNVKSWLRISIIQFITLLPLLSWGLGKYDSYRIKNNISYHYIVDDKRIKKIILYSSKYVILTTMHNDSIFISGSDKYNGTAILAK